MSRLLFVLLLFSFQARAVWYESTGHANIRNGDTETARTVATEDAIKQALLFSGAQVFSVQSVANGIWQGEQVNLGSHGAIEHIEVISEAQSNGIMSITLRLDILATSDNCQQAILKKPFTLIKTNIANPQHAQYGQIFAIDKAFSSQLSKRFDLNGGVVNAPSLTTRLSIASYFKHISNDKRKTIQQIAQVNQAQFVLLSQITDMSLGERQDSSLTFWNDKTYERFFAIETLLFNGITGELISNKQYQQSGLWEYKKNAIVDTNSNGFWHSDYGLAMTNTAEKIVRDTASTIACLPILGTITAISGNTIKINLGSQHGLVKGQKLAVSQTQPSLLDGINSAVIVDSDHFVRVEQVYQNYAVAKIIGESFLANIQTQDLVRLVISPEENL